LGGVSMKRFRVLVVTLVVLAGSAAALTLTAFTTSYQSRYPALDAITEEELRADVYTLADDDFRGREAGTMDELHAAAWLAGQAREIGLVPMGEDGSYFQYFPLRRIRVSEASPIEIGEQRFEVWQDAILLLPVDAVVDDELVWVGDTPNEELDENLIRGRAVAAMTLEPTRGPSPDASLFEWRYARAAARERAQALIVRGAVAVVLVSDSISDSVFDMVAQWQRRGSTRADSEGTQRRPADQPPVLAVRKNRLGDVSQGQRIRAAISTESFVFPSANVVAAVPGTDPSVADEYVLFSGHHDHDGVRWPVDGDSIYNGADDNVSACAALLAIGRAFVQSPGRRGALFVWHGEGALRLQVVRRKSHGAYREDHGGAERGHDLPQSPRLGGHTGHAPPEQELLGSGGDGSGRQRRRSRVRPGPGVGPTRPSGGFLLPQRPRALLTEAGPGPILHRPPPRGLPHTQRRVADAGLPEAAPLYAMDVCHRVACGAGGPAAPNRRGVGVQALRLGGTPDPVQPSGSRRCLRDRDQASEPLPGGSR